MAENAVSEVDERQKLFLFMAGELQGACNHIFSSFDEYFRSGKEPESAFTGKGPGAAGKKKRGRAKKDSNKPKRKPTAFNNFIKEKISQFREEGKIEEMKGDNNGVFAAAVAEWGKLTDDEKKVYTANFKEHAGADEAEALAAAEAEAKEAAQGAAPAAIEALPVPAAAEDESDDDDEEDSDEDEDEDDEEDEEPAPPPKEPTPPPPEPEKKEKKRKNKAAAEPANGKKAKPAPAAAKSAAKPAPKAEPALTANAPAPVATKPGEKKPKKKAKAADTKDAK